MRPSVPRRILSLLAVSAAGLSTAGAADFEFLYEAALSWYYSQDVLRTGTALAEHAGHALEGILQADGAGDVELRRVHDTDRRRRAHRSGGDAGSGDDDRRKRHDHRVG